MTADDFNSSDIRTQLRSLDRLLISNNATVMDLLEQAIVAANIVEDTAEPSLVVGPLELMLNKIDILQSQLDHFVSSQNNQGAGSYLGSTGNYYWSDNPHLDPARNYPAGYAWNPLIGRVVKTSTGSGI